MAGGATLAGPLGSGVDEFDDEQAADAIRVTPANPVIRAFFNVPPKGLPA